jgi:group I intron endonuclease
VDTCGPINIRFYSIKNDNNNVNPAVVYLNADTQKKEIMEENRGKSGIYRWVNLLNNKTYIGSSVDLKTRFYIYYSAKRLNDSNMVIYKALQKHGYSNFSLEILEYCEPDQTVLKEQEYIDLLKPEYNINPTAGSSLGYKHSAATLEKLRNRDYSFIHNEETRLKLSAAATGRVLSEEARAKISAARRGIKLSIETRAKMSAATTAIHGVAVEVTNIKTGDIVQYSTMTSAGAALGVSRTAIKKVIDSGKIFRDNYTIKLVKKG